MKRRAALAILFVACVAAIVVLKHRDTKTIPPVLVVVRAANEAELTETLARIGLGVAIDEKAEDRSVSLALSAVSDKNAKELAEALQELLFRSEVRANPLVVDLEGKEPDAELRRVFSAIAPTLHAARSISTRMHPSKERDVVAIVSDTCPVSSTVECVSLWAPGDADGKDVARARFLAGPISDAVLLDANDSTAADALAQKIMASSSNHIAIAFTARTLVARNTPRTLEVNSYGRLAANFFKDKGTREQRELLELLAQPVVPSAPWLKLPEPRVVIVPRMSSRAMLPAFVAEVTAIVGSHVARWERSPVAR